MKGHQFLDSHRGSSDAAGILAILAIVVVAIIVVAIAVPIYTVWKNEKRGEAQFREAEWSKKVAIEEARALKEAAPLLAEAEIERAHGVAEANEIIGTSLKDNDGYLQYLWIQGLHDGSSETIYIPVEANLPIMEATRNLRVNDGSMTDPAGG